MTDALKSKTSKKAEKEMEEQAESISKLMKKALKNDKITIKVEKLKNKKISSMITLSEESRRMQDMMKMYSMPGMDMSAFGGEGETLTADGKYGAKTTEAVRRYQKRNSLTADGSVGSATWEKMF